MFFSDYFEVDPNLLERYGAINISLICDIPLFIDPMLIYSSGKPEYIALHNEITRYFLYLSENSNTAYSKELLIYLYGFPEIKNNWLGYSKKGNGGSGNGRKFALMLRDYVGFMVNSNGISKSQHIEKLSLINDGIGKDKISDMVTNISLRFLLEYTQEFAERYIDPKYLYKFNIDRVFFDYDFNAFKNDCFILPFIINSKGKKEFVLLTPAEILRADEPAINLKNFERSYEDILSSIDNPVLRALVFQHIEKEVQELRNKKTNKRKISDAQIEKASREAFIGFAQENPKLYDYFIKYLENESDNTTKESSEERKTIIENFVTNIMKFNDENTYVKPVYMESNSLEEARHRIKFFKDRIENGGAYKLFNNKTRKLSNEDDFQRAFTLIWYGSHFKVSVETNNGRGPVDFNVSMGQSDQVNIEFKLASNSKLVKVFSQVAVYNAAHGTDNSIIVIAYYTDAEKKRVDKFIKDFSTTITEGENLFLLDCRLKESASKV